MKPQFSAQLGIISIFSGWQTWTYDNYIDDNTLCTGGPMRRYVDGYILIDASNFLKRFWLCTKNEFTEMP
jgi:hypothetical protein